MNGEDVVSAIFGLLLIVGMCVLCFRWLSRARTRWQGLLRGGITGGVMGIMAAGVLGVVFTLLHPEDPSAGSVAIIGIATFPLGFVVGAVIGLFRRTDDSQSDLQ